MGELVIGGYQIFICKQSISVSDNIITAAETEVTKREHLKEAPPDEHQVLTKEEKKISNHIQSIAILLPSLAGGGAERVSLDLAYEFTRSGHDVEFVVMQAHGELSAEVRASFSTVDLAIPRFRAMLHGLVRYLRRQRPDILLAAMWPLTVIAPLAQRLSGHCCRVIVSEHGILSAQYHDRGQVHRLLLRLSTGLGYRLADRCIGVSIGVALDMAHLSRVKKNKVDVVYNPIPSPLNPDPAALEMADRLWCGPKGARIVTVGKMKAVKNYPLLLRAFAQLERQDVQLMFVGEGVGYGDLVSLARELGVIDRVSFVGFQSDPTPFYKTADLFVLSSAYEGFGNVIVEAMACGTPVVATDCPSGPSEILEGGRYGRLVPAGDALALALAMEASLSSTPDRDSLIRRAEDFAPQVAAHKYLKKLDL